MSTPFASLPAWNLSREYPSIDSAAFTADELHCEKLQGEIHEVLKTLTPELHGFGPGTSPRAIQSIVSRVQTILLLKRELLTLLQNLGTFVFCLKAVEALDATANAKQSEIQARLSTFFQSIMPVLVFLTTTTEEVFEMVIAHPELQCLRFGWSRARSMRHTRLSEAEEILITALAPPTMKSWGDLYYNLSGTLKVEMDWQGTQALIGISEASGRLRSSDESERKSAWLGLQKTWKQQQETVAAILNALAGWRLELVQKRSHTAPVHFLTFPLFDGRIEKSTLEAMMTAIASNKTDIQAAVKLMARAHKKDRLDPWDLMAPAPLKGTMAGTPFPEALSKIRAAFASADPEFGEFVNLMSRNEWIEARVLPNKRNGAFCTGFVKSKTPLVFQTYLGSNYDITTLAHELGHAYHSWTLRNQSIDEDFPMTLAETASIFAETLLSEETIASAQTHEEKLDIAWMQAESAVSYLLNIPARFDFEQTFYEKRQHRKVSADELSTLTNEAWSKWYGDTLSANDTMYWATKLHFSMAEVSFYNFPYTFGYLFALSIYARRREFGDQFWPKYKALLQDTTRMTAEELVLKYLGEDITQPEFWQKAIDVVKGQINSFKELLDPE